MIKKIVQITNGHGGELEVSNRLKGIFDKQGFENFSFSFKSYPILNIFLDLIFVGRLTLLKGFHDLLEVSSLMKEVSLIVVGDGILKERIPKKDNILFIEKIENKENKKLYDQAKIFILPSYTEVFPLTVLEGMARGLVILASDINEMREIVKEGENGYLFPPGDTKRMVELTSYLKDNPEEMERISENKLRDIKNYTTQEQGLKYIDIFVEVTKK